MKRNCWTCAHDIDEGDGFGHGCEVINDCDPATQRWWSQIDTPDDSPDMPHRDADGCPGWEPKHENADYWKRQARIMCAEARGWRAAFESMMMDEETCRKGVVQVSRVDNQLNHLRGEK